MTLSRNPLMASTPMLQVASTALRQTFPYQQGLKADNVTVSE